MGKIQVGDTVRVTRGKYAGTVGTYKGKGDVYTEGVGYTNCVGEGSMELATGAQHCDAGGEKPPKKSREYAEWERVMASGDENAIERYSREHFNGQVEHTGLGRLLFGKWGDRFTRKN